MKIAKKNDVMVLDLSDLETKRRLMAKVGQLRGLHSVMIKPRRRQRTLDQNDYYWAAFVTPFMHWLRGEWGDPGIELEDAHDELKRKLLPVRIKRYRNGEIRELLAHTPELNTEEFTNYLDRAEKFLAEFCGIVVLPAEMFGGKKAA